MGVLVGVAVGSTLVGATGVLVGAVVGATGVLVGSVVAVAVAGMGVLEGVVVGSTGVLVTSPPSTGNVASVPAEKRRILYCVLSVVTDEALW